MLFFVCFFKFRAGVVPLASGAWPLGDPEAWRRESVKLILIEWVGSLGESVVRLKNPQSGLWQLWLKGRKWLSTLIFVKLGDKERKERGDGFGFRGCL